MTMLPRMVRNGSKTAATPEAPFRPNGYPAVGRQKSSRQRENQGNLAPVNDGGRFFVSAGLSHHEIVFGIGCIYSTGQESLLNGSFFLPPKANVTLIVVCTSTGSPRKRYGRYFHSRTALSEGSCRIAGPHSG